MLGILSNLLYDVLHHILFYSTMQKLKVTCAEKYVLIDKEFKFDFPVEYTEHHQLNQKQFSETVKGQNVIIISDLVVDETVLHNNPDLRLIALCSTGYNHVDLSLLKKHGVKLCNIRGYAGDAVAEHAFTLMINLIKNFNAQVNAIKDDVWAKQNSSFCLAAPMGELKGKTLTILGKGEIGLSLSEKAKAFGMHVIFSEHMNAPICRQGYVPFEEAIMQADVLSLHCVLNQDTKHIINSSVISKMTRGSILINVGRGGLVNTNDVISALNNSHLAGYGTDVLEEEPPRIDNPLINLQKTNHNVIVTGHIGWATNEAQQRLFNILEDNINKNIQGKDQNLVRQ